MRRLSLPPSSSSDLTSVDVFLARVKCFLRSWSCQPHEDPAACVFHAHVWKGRHCEAPWAAGLGSAEPGLNLYLLIPRPGFPCIMGPRGDITFASLWARLGVSLQAAVGSRVVQEGALRLKRGVCGGLRGCRWTGQRDRIRERLAQAVSWTHVLPSWR